MSGTRDRAADVVGVVADLLRDPERVAATACAPDNVDVRDDGSSVQPWRPPSLAEGFAGSSLLFAELGRQDAAARQAAHDHLAQACADLQAHEADGLFDGVAAVAFAARAAKQAPGEYDSLLGTLDEHLLSAVATRTEAERARAARGVAAEPAAYDVVNGLAGLGGYLLAAGHRDTLSDVVQTLTALTVPMPERPDLPGWWVPHGPLLGPDGFGPEGHLNLGMAHGVSGALALLALAWREGVRVPGQEAAARGVAEWLVARRFCDAAGPYWPSTLSLAEEAAAAQNAAGETSPVRSSGSGPPGRTAWCYGTPGVARALQLAGDAFGTPSWTDDAVDTLASVLTHEIDGHGAGATGADDRPRPGSPVDAGLCHGWAGVLQVTWRIANDTGDDRLIDATRWIAGRVLDAFDPAAPFGFRYVAGFPAAADRAGLLEGAAGIALALHTYASDTEPATIWDRALAVA